MMRICVSCGQPTIAGREIDCAIRILDPDPGPDGGAVLAGDVNDWPTVVWGTDPEGDTWPDGTPIPAGSPRYFRHECEGEVATRG